MVNDLIVRPLHTEAEYATYYRLAEYAFSPEPSEEEAARWHENSLHSPDFDPERVRGAFRGEQLLGGYMVHDCVLRMGKARISVGGIGAVVTDPQARKQGVASALLLDAQAFARAHVHALLLLDGIPNFYYRFGYTDMFDATAVEVKRSAILAQAPTPYKVRPITQEDAPALLALYERHYGSYTGSFERSLEIQAYRVQHRRLPVLMAVSPEGKVEGYLQHGTDAEMSQGREVAADSWQALLALLRYHALLFADDSAPAELQYFLPLESSAVHWMIDRLEVPDTSSWQNPSQGWGVRSLTSHHRFTGWMGSLIHFPLLLDSMLPEFQARWQRALAHWNGEIALSVEGETRVLRCNGTGIELAEQPGTPAAQRLELTPQAAVQLVFGYRPVQELSDISHLPETARAALALLFPTGHTWLPRSDWF
jgi:predicted N-acetyltransferase YhbS